MWVRGMRNPSINSDLSHVQEEPEGLSDSSPHPAIVPLKDAPPVMQVERQTPAPNYQTVHYSRLSRYTSASWVFTIIHSSEVLSPSATQLNLVPADIIYSFTSDVPQILFHQYAPTPYPHRRFVTFLPVITAPTHLWISFLFRMPNTSCLWGGDKFPVPVFGCEKHFNTSGAEVDLSQMSRCTHMLSVLLLIFYLVWIRCRFIICHKVETESRRSPRKLFTLFSTSEAWAGVPVGVRCFSTPIAEVKFKYSMHISTVLLIPVLFWSNIPPEKYLQ